jgi:AcrR family transcriptional regulator
MVLVEMPKEKPRRGRAHWVEAALEALTEGGLELVRVEPLAVRLGVTKGSFYWHFSRREELVAAMLDAWEEAGTNAIIAEIDARGGGPEERLRALWRRTSGEPRLETEMAIRDLARRDPEVRERVRRVDDRRVAYLRALFLELGLDAPSAEARSLLLYSLLLGNPFIEASHGRTSRVRVLERAVAELLRR